MKKLLAALPLVILATDAHAVVHIPVGGVDPGAAILLSVVASVALIFVARVMMRKR
jgi:hypothetical protein